MTSRYTRSKPLKGPRSPQSATKAGNPISPIERLHSLLETPFGTSERPGFISERFSVGVTLPSNGTTAPTASVRPEKIHGPTGPRPTELRVETEDLNLPGDELEGERTVIDRRINEPDMQRLIVQTPVGKDETVESMERRDVERFVEYLQSELDKSNDTLRRKNCSKWLHALVKQHGVLPSSLFIEDVICDERTLLLGGGCADIYQGCLGNQVVCLKVLRFFTAEVDQRKKAHKSFCREALWWRQLRHPNILPFFGVNTTRFYPSFCFISPWMENGSIMTYLKSNPGHDRLKSFVEIAEGLSYLHSFTPPIVHADIKGDNILIKDDLTCCLADFGMTLAVETHMNRGSSSGSKGTTRWLAPEIMMPDLFPKPSKLTGRDIYALGCTMLEILTGKVPFFEEKRDVVVVMTVVNGGRPSRPNLPPSSIWSSDSIWNVIQSCWLQNCQERASADDVLRALKSIVHQSTL